MMKKYFFITLLFISVFGIAQTDTGFVSSDQLISAKNELDLDIEAAGIHISYKRKISKRIYIGYSIGGGILFRFETKASYLTTDILRQKIFMDVQISKRFHVYEAFTYALDMIYDDGGDGNSGTSIGLEMGFFLR